MRYFHAKNSKKVIAEQMQIDLITVNEAPFQIFLNYMVEININIDAIWAHALHE